MKNEHLYGPGKRFLIFLQGCSLHCKGCVNEHLWEFGKGNNISVDNILTICKENNVDGITFHGGEPLDQAHELVDVVRLLKQNGFSIVLFTGYNKKELTDEQLHVWNNADIVVCGRFVETKKNLYLQFRGSTNQRVITHKGKYKDYKVKDGKTVAIFTLDGSGNVNIKGFRSGDVNELLAMITQDEK